MKEKLFMILLGCKPTGRSIEQHDIFFGIAASIKALVPAIKGSWKGSGKIHIDAWREVTNVDDYELSVIKKEKVSSTKSSLFFINLGGYKPNCFDEFHYKMLTVSESKAAAILAAKQTVFYQHTGFGKIANSHIDDKYGVDVDDIFEISDILSEDMKKDYSIKISATTSENLPKDEMNLGYFKLDGFV